MTTSPSRSRRSRDLDFAFDRETAITPAGPGLWRTMIRSDWNINSNPNGGYALTPLLRAMSATAGAPAGAAAEDRAGGGDGHVDPISLTTHFLRPAIGDEPAELEVELIRRGRRTSTVRATMVQQGKARLESVASFAAPSAGPSDAEPNRFRIDIEPPQLPPPEQCPSRAMLSQGVELPLLSRIEARIDPRHAQPAGAAEPVIAGWIRLLDGRQPDAMTLPLFADCFPPSIFGLVGRTGWVPTIELTVHVRRRPAPGWIRGRFVTTEVAGTTVIEDGILWDSADRVVAQSRQLALVTD